MHKYWKYNYLGLEPTTDGKSNIEIEESKVITYNNTTKWLLCLWIDLLHMKYEYFM